MTPTAIKFPQNSTNHQISTVNMHAAINPVMNAQYPDRDTPVNFKTQYIFIVNVSLTQYLQFLINIQFFLEELF